MASSAWPHSRRWTAPSLLALAGAAAAGGAILARRSPEARTVGRRLLPGGGGSNRTQDARQPWTCECGQAYLVSGRDRHTIFWLEGAAESDPLLSDICPECDRNLSAEHRRSQASASPTATG
jgi:hypothetical protein